MTENIGDYLRGGATQRTAIDRPSNAVRLSPRAANVKLRFSILVSLLVVLNLAPRIAKGAEGPYKIRIGFPSLAFSYMPFYVAQEKGFYKKHGIESEYIQMATTIQPQAVIAGNINYLTSVSTGISAGIAGLPLVIVLNFCDTSPWVLVTHKDINKPQDLIGKTVALSGSAPRRITIFKRS